MKTSLLALLAASTLFADIPIPLGKTSLLNIGVYHVVCQGYGQTPVNLPIGWTGDDSQTGTVYNPSCNQDQLPALLLHSPWKLGAGLTYVDYRLQLPDVKPLFLSFSIAMRHGCLGPKLSDGVTFSAYAFAPENAPRELFREHCVSDKWKPFTFDLSDFTGKTCIVRLQVEPGPANKPDFDFSYFGNPCIIAGLNDTDAIHSQAITMANSQPLKATRNASLLPLNNTHANGVLPGNLLDCQNTVKQLDNKTWIFTYSGTDGMMVYRLALQTGTPADFTLQFNDQEPFPIANGCCLELDKPVKNPSFNCQLDNDVLTITAKQETDDGLLQTVWRYSIHNKALAFTVTADKPIVKALHLGNAIAPLRQIIHTPYFGEQLSYLIANKLYTCRKLDWTKSNATNSDTDAIYDRKTDGARNLLSESGYIAFSPQPGEVFPNIPFPPSKYRDVLGPLVIFDFWGIKGNHFANDADVLRMLKDHGLDHIGIIYHCWQRYGYDNKLPDHFPANPAWGGEEAMKKLGLAAKDCGFLFALHENYIDMYPDAPSYDKGSIALHADGSMFKAWYNSGSKVQSYLLKGNHALRYAMRNAPEIHKRYFTTMGYIDAQTCGSPGWRVDHDATQPMAAMARLKVQTELELYDFMRKTHGGPFLGEGNAHYFWAGPCDGVEAQTDGENQSPFLDFDLLKLHPQMTNHGMGYYGRWHHAGYNMTWGYDAGSQERIDKYRAQEIAYGHAGLVSSPQVDNPLWAACEHHIMHAIQRLYGTAKITAIDYEIDGEYIPAAAALPFGLTGRQRLRYDNGAELWINWLSAPWTVKGHQLAQWGVYAEGTDGRVWTANLNGSSFSDYAECPEYVFANARTSFDMPYMLDTRPLAEISIQNFKYLGDNKMQISYHWKCLVKSPDLTGCFIHFVNPAAERDDKLTFQNDHGLPFPTAEWEPGKEGTTGPFTLTIPDGFTYHDITFGLLDSHGNRMRLRNPLYNMKRYHLGRLQLTLDDSKKITDARLLPVAGLKNLPQKQEELDFTAHLSKPGTMIDFGTVATDGAVKINRNDASLKIYTYPRNSTVRLRINLSTFPCGIQTRRLTAHAPLTGESLGDIPYTIEKGLLIFTANSPNTAYYLWQ